MNVIPKKISNKTPLTIDEAYQLAEICAMKVLQKYGMKGWILDAEDLRGEYMVYFLEKGFLQKYNPQTTSKMYYIYIGVRNFYISYSSRKTRVIPQPESYFSGDESIIAYLGKINNDFVGQIIVDEYLRGLDDTRRNSGYSDKIIFEMHYSGVRRGEIAEHFGISSARVGQIIKKCAQQLREKLSEDYAEELV